MTNDTTLATAWLEGLAARGITVTTKNGRLWLHPKDAYRELTDDEVITLRHHRPAIKALVSAAPAVPDRAQAGPRAAPCWPVWRSGAAGAPMGGLGSQPPGGPLAEPKPKPEPVCPYCRRPCIGPAHHAYGVLHYTDPAEVKKRDEHATKVMLKQIGRGLPDGYR